MPWTDDWPLGEGGDWLRKHSAQVQATHLCFPPARRGRHRDHPFLGSLRDCHLKKSISECRLFSEMKFYSQWPLHPKSSTYNLISFLSSMYYKIDNYSKASTWLRSLSSIFKNCSCTEEPLGSVTYNVIWTLSPFRKMYLRAFENYRWSQLYQRKLRLRWGKKTRYSE